jgi:hypothetical protein
MLSEAERLRFILILILILDIGEVFVRFLLQIIEEGVGASSKTMMDACQDAMSLDLAPAIPGMPGAWATYRLKKRRRQAKARPLQVPGPIIASRPSFFANCERKHQHTMSISSREINPQ